VKPSAFFFGFWARPARCRWLLALLPLAAGVPASATSADGAAAASAATSASEVAAAWDLLERMLYQDAAPAFDRLRAAPDASPAVQLGHAVSLLFRQPRTRANLSSAETTLQELARSADLRWGLLARYYLARFDHVHAFEPDLERAEARYGELWREFPGTELGQRAFLHAAILAQHQPAGPEDKRRQLEALDRAATGLTEPSLRRIYHFHAGEAWQRWLGEPSRAYDHYRSASEGGLTRLDDQANLLVRLAELAVALDEPAEARRWHEEFLREFPRDPRAHLLRQRLEGMNLPVAPPRP
jgi:hypothetical protein